MTGKANSAPNKPSLNGAHTAKLFKRSNLPSTSDRVWKDIVIAERNGGADGTIRHDRMACWATLEKLLPYFTGLTLTQDQRTSFKNLAHEFGRLFVKVHGEHHVTHYLVSSQKSKVGYI